ncbi:glycosyltransferase family 2 protein [Yeosuana marina]|uniref:glycosyltransferase family 2 protein n=1 Tax=Yeosuana marina TaxID=1565536 RepID=UPI0030C7F8FF
MENNINPILSVIIPIYNVEKHVEKCIKSALNINLKNTQIILINDGSTDKSGLIADSFSKSDSRVKVIHSINKGVSHARNLGLKHATAKWVYFIDGDDEVYENAFDNIDFDENFKMVLGNFSWVNINETRFFYSDNDIGIYNGHEIVLKYGLCKQKILMGSFIINREIIKSNNLEFNINTKYAEDVEFIYYCLLNSSKVISVSNTFFNYKMHNESAISKISFNRFDNYISKERVLNYIYENFSHLEDQKSMFQGLVLPEALINTLELLCKKGFKLSLINKHLKENNFNKSLLKKNFNNYTSVELKNKISLYSSFPLIFYISNYYNEEYYNLRVFISKSLRFLFKNKLTN